MGNEDTYPEMHELAKSSLRPVAVSAEEVNDFGCPYCGYRSGHMPITGNGTAIVVCGECGRDFAMLAEGMTKSGIGMSGHYPELIPHPRRGTPKHGRPDKRPEHGGEYFSSRGVGTDVAPGCFICGGAHRNYHNIAAFVQCKEAGERVVNMFKQGAWLDYRENEPDRVQVKIGACDQHRVNLKLLSWMTVANDGVITDKQIEEAMNP